MGQKVSPTGLRVGIIYNWDTNWIASKENQATFLYEDILIRKYLTKNLRRAGMIAKILIARNDDKKVFVTIHTAKPGFIMGENGAHILKITKQLHRILKRKRIVKIELKPINNPDADSRILAEWIAEQLENRMSFRTVQKKAIQKAMRAGVKGIKTLVSGRLGGTDIARAEGYSRGIVPLHTFRSDVEYAFSQAKTTYGLLGVKVWVCHGEILEGMK